MDKVHSEKISVQGLVQGVGFRPTVWQLASQFNLCGEVYNDGQGVQIIAQGPAPSIDAFILHLESHCPPLARIDKIQREVVDHDTVHDSFIISSSRNTRVQTGIVADAATCPACLKDINDKANRRYGYAFTNCTHCGPRLSIIRDIPYDRAHTSMAAFKLCKACAHEYEDPADRRFHAQPNACPDCGPVLTLLDNLGQPVSTEDVISTTAQLMQQGHIIAIKGIGGFQLACDAHNDEAVITLRLRKHREQKALALMAASVQQIERYSLVSSAEQQLLESHAAPIVILPQKKPMPELSEHIAPAQHNLGFMLPYSPLHHLLMQQLDKPIVLTSGNACEQPQCIDNQQALESLNKVADYFVMHNRDIVNRVDDSVVRWINDNMVSYRRARGYAPSPIILAQELESNRQILACGGELKNTFCLLKQGKATLSQHMGNLENMQTYEDYLKTLSLYEHLFQFKAQAIAVDSHPEYLSSKFGRSLAEQHNLPLIEIQHHHAHIASCLAENQWTGQDGKVIGVALDGLGYGDDGTIWGGEFMLADYLSYERLARLKPTPMPGSTQAILEPWRNTFAQLSTHADWSELSSRYSHLELLQYLADKPMQTLQRMIDSQTNSPLTSSCGRLFDAVAAALGICRDRISYEGQAAIELEALINANDLEQVEAYPLDYQADYLFQIDPAPMWQALLEDLDGQKSKSEMSARFHLALVDMIQVTVMHIKQQTGLDTVALSGGVYQNPTLLSLSQKRLKQQGFTVLCHSQVPSNDGGLSLGQAAIASAQLKTGVI